MTEVSYAVDSPRLALLRTGRVRRAAALALLWTLVAGNAAALVWLWVHGGNVSDDLTTGELLTSVSRITGLLGAYAASCRCSCSRVLATGGFPDD